MRPRKLPRLRPPTPAWHRLRRATPKNQQKRRLKAARSGEKSKPTKKRNRGAVRPHVKREKAERRWRGPSACTSSSAARCYGAFRDATWAAAPNARRSTAPAAEKSAAPTGSHPGQRLAPARARRGLSRAPPAQLAAGHVGPNAAQPPGLLQPLVPCVWDEVELHTKSRPAHETDQYCHVSGEPQRAARPARAFGRCLHWTVLKSLLPFIWPAGRRDLRIGVAAAFVVLVIAKLVAVAVPIAFKWVTDWLASDLAMPDVAAKAPSPRRRHADRRLWRRPRPVHGAEPGPRRALHARRPARHPRAQLLYLPPTFTSSLRFHLERRTGGLSRVIERGVSRRRPHRTHGRHAARADRRRDGLGCGPAGLVLRLDLRPGPRSHRRSLHVVHVLG